MKELVLKISIAILFVICSYVFISVKLTSTTMFNMALVEPERFEHEDFTKYGELYYRGGLVDHFKEELPPATLKFRFSDKQSSIEDADILMYGDSHLDHTRQTTYPERIKDSTNLNVFYFRIRNPYKGNVLAYLKDQNFENSENKILVYQSAERYVIDRSEVEYQNRPILSVQKSRFQWLKTIKDKIFNPQTELIYSMMLKRSYLTSYVYSRISTLKFNLFGFISPSTPEYVLKDKGNSWLFYKESVNYVNRDDIDDDLVRNSAVNVKKLQQKLKELYNIDLIYMIIPDKYAIYNIHNSGIEYHNFIPKLHAEFRNMGIPYIDLYSEYAGNRKEFFYKTDTHWNENGVDIAVKNTLEYFEELH